MVDPQYLYRLFINLVDGDKGHRPKQKLPLPLHSARPANQRRVLQRPKPLVQKADSWLPILRLMVPKISANALQIRCRGQRPANPHLGTKHPLEPGIHRFFFDELVPLSASLAFQHSSTETSIFRQQRQGRVLKQFANICSPLVAGNLSQLRLLDKLPSFGLLATPDYPKRHLRATDKRRPATIGGPRNRLRFRLP